jgi:hypothetical protein
MGEQGVGFERSEARVTTIFRSAAEFGLTQEEILATVTATLDRLPENMQDRCIEELSEGLAMRLMANQRRFERGANAAQIR